MPGTSTKAAQRNRIAQLADSVSQGKMVPMNHPIKKAYVESGSYRMGTLKLAESKFKSEVELKL